MDNLEYIESYFKGSNTDAQKQQFEKKILDDASFADEVAFYISANGIIKEQLSEKKKQRFWDMYEQQKVVSIRQPVRNLWKYLAAASVIFAVILLTWFFSNERTSPQQLADKYIQQTWPTLPVTMGAQDSFQIASGLFNSQKFSEALVIFETLAQKDPPNSNLKKYAGIVALRLGNYDKALEYFTMLEADTALYSNPGKFYKAITLLKRNKNDDVATAKKLLQEVKEGKENLEGKNEAGQWLNQLD